MKYVQTAVVLAVAVLVVGCGSDGLRLAVQINPPTTTAGPTDVDAVCGRLVDLANSVLGAQTATSADDVAAQVRPALADFGDAAASGGDTELAHQAGLATTAFESYLSGDNSAGTEFNVALDAAGARCVQMGYSAKLPAQPPAAGPAPACASDRKTLETAIEAYWANTGVPPASEDDLVSAGLLHGQSDGFDITADGGVVVVSGGACDQ